MEISQVCLNVCLNVATASLFLTCLFWLFECSLFYVYWFLFFFFFLFPVSVSLNLPQPQLQEPQNFMLFCLPFLNVLLGAGWDKMPHCGRQEALKGCNKAEEKKKNIASQKYGRESGPRQRRYRLGCSPWLLQQPGPGTSVPVPPLLFSGCSPRSQNSIFDMDNIVILSYAVLFY